MSVKITALNVENVKRVRAVHLTPAESGLTVIGGRNGAGKTSLLDAIAWTLGGAKYAPSDAGRDGAATPPATRIEMSNGLIVERKGRNAALKVTDPSGQRAGQALLDSFVSAFALDLPAFMAASPKEKAEALLQTIGVGDELEELAAREDELRQERLVTGRALREAEGHAKELPSYPEAGEDAAHLTDLAAEYEAAVTDAARYHEAADDLYNLRAMIAGKREMIGDLKAKLEELEKAVSDHEMELAERKAWIADVTPPDVDAIRARMRDAEAMAEKASANRAKREALAKAEDLRKRHAELERDIDGVRTARARLLEDATLPLPGLGVDGGELTYQGKRWDCMSGSEQLRVATAISSQINPQCGFVLLDKLEQMDSDTLQEFGAWAESLGLQIIATRVGTGESCSIIIEDGEVSNADG
jgi:DNA repair ATPase RecN